MREGGDKTGEEQPHQLRGRNPARIFPAAFIFLASFIVYAGALAGGFIYDDNLQVLKNPLIRDLRHIPEIFLRSAWTFEGAPETSNYYRPLQNLIYLFTSYAFGLRAWGFHLVNILFHSSNALLVYFLTVRITGGLQPSATRVSVSLPLIAALLFATHPVNTEAVIWIAGLPDVSFVFFYLLSFYLYLRWKGKGVVNYLFSLAAFFLSTLCKEPGITLPVVLVAYDAVFRAGPFWSLGTVRRHLPYLIVAGLYLALRTAVLGDIAPLVPVVATSSLVATISVFPLFSRYLQLLVLPINLNFWPVFDPLTSLLSLRGIMALAISTAFLGAAAAAFRKKSGVFLSLMIILAPLLPALYIQGIIGKPIAERYLYLSTFGFGLLPAFLLIQARKGHQQAAAVFSLILLLVIGAYSAGTIARTMTWKDASTLFFDTVTKSPDSLVPRLELANALLVKGDLDAAIMHYRAAARMDPGLYIVHYNLGIALEKKRLLNEAAEQYLIAARLNPTLPDIHADAGRAFAKAGFLDLAADQLLLAVQLQPANAYQRNLLGVVYVLKGLIDQAIVQFSEAVSLSPSAESYRRNLSDAMALKKSDGSTAAQAAGFGERYEERPITSADIIKFAR